MAKPMDKEAIADLMNAIAALLEGRPPREVGGTLSALAGVWLGAYPPVMWPNLLGTFSSAMRRVAEQESLRQHATTGTEGRG